MSGIADTEESFPFVVGLIHLKILILQSLRPLHAFCGICHSMWCGNLDSVVSDGWAF